MNIKNKHLFNLNLNKPEKLILEDLIKPELPFFVPVRKDDGSHRYEMTNGKKLQKHIPALYYFIHVLLERQFSDNDALKLKYDNNFVKMFSRDIEPLKSKNYFRLLWGILRSLKIIEVFDNNEPNIYRKSAMAYYFMFLEPYRSSPVIQHQIQINKSINDKLKQKWNISKSNKLFDVSKITSNKILAHQYLALRNINLDSLAAKQHADELFQKKILNIHQYNTCNITINNIVNERIYATKSDKCNRFYTNVTNLPKVIRLFIKDKDGKSFVELDFGSFNAFVVYKILNSMNPEFKFNAEKIAFENELDLYRRLLSSGDFYKDFKQVMFPNEDLNRDQIKEIVLRHWFNGRLNSRNKYRKHIMTRLPRISEIINSMKSEKYENFSIIAMKMESELVNEIVYKKFIDTYPDAIMYTIFDSFLVEPKWSAMLQSMMLEEGSRFFNINCIVRAK